MKFLPRYNSKRTNCVQGKNWKTRGAYAGRHAEERRRIEARKARGTSKNRNKEGRRKGSGRVEAYISDDRDRRGFPNNAASERSDRVSRGELVQEARHIEARERRRENTRRIQRRIKRLKERRVFLFIFNSVLAFPHLIPVST